jgi:hypothetical protein
MKKIIVPAIAVIMMATLSIPAMANDARLFSVADSWYVDIPAAGMVIFSDNHDTYSMLFETADSHFLGLQRDFRGQLNLVGFVANEEEPYIVSITVVAADVSLSVQHVPGNTNPHTFTITETIETLWSNDKIKTHFEKEKVMSNISNNYRGMVGILGYNVYIDVRGNTTVVDASITNFEKRELPRY